MISNIQKYSPCWLAEKTEPTDEAVTLKYNKIITPSIIRTRISVVFKMLANVLFLAKCCLFNAFHRKFFPNEHRFGSDVEQLKLEYVGTLGKQERFNLRHIDSFFEVMSTWWNHNNMKYALHMFKTNLRNMPTDTAVDAFKYVESIVKEKKIPRITYEDINVIHKLHIFFNNNDEISYRDMKVFHNIFVRCVNYATKHDPMNLYKVMQLAQVFSCYHKHSQLSNDDARRLRDDGMFMSLLHVVKKHVMKEVHTNLSRSLLSIIDYFIDKTSNCIEYGHIFNLMITANAIYKLNVKNLKFLSSQTKQDLAMLETAYHLGFISCQCFDEVTALRRQCVDISDEDIKEKLLKHGLNDQKLNNMRVCIIALPNVVKKATNHIHLPLDLVI